MTRVRLASPLFALIALSGVGACGCSAATSASDQAASQPAGNAKSPQQSALQLLSRAESPALAAVKPPSNPKISDHYISEKKLATLPVPQQPPELAKALADLQTGSIEERKAKLKTKVFADMVYVRGGSFMRGDFAKLMGIDGVTRMTSKSDDKVVKEITLSDFWISKYKVTYAEFDVFTDATGRGRTGMEFDGRRRYPTIPARAYWQSAKDYCQWLGQLTGLPVDLPTEAQWEYAARSRGQFFMISTDNGNVDYGRNMPYQAQEEVVSPMGERGRYPIALFPPNPLGLYDMSGDGPEWINDWYAFDAYSTAETSDPKGPATGSRKTIRGRATDSPLVGSAVHRYSDLPVPMWAPEGKMIPGLTSGSPALRCVIATR